MKTNLIDQIDKLSKVAMGDQLFENYFPSFSEFATWTLNLSTA